MTMTTDALNPEEALAHWRTEEAAVRTRQTSNQELSENPTFRREILRAEPSPTPSIHNTEHGAHHHG